jgi:hypothetical protein
MSTSATGRLVDEHGAPLANLRVVIRDESGFSSDLTPKDSDGRFPVQYADDATPELGTRKLGVYVYTQGHRLLYKTSKDDVATAVLPLGDITIPSAEATGWTVTLGGSPAALPVRDGNAIRVLIDNEAAWGHLKNKMLTAATSINVMQLEFDVPNIEGVAGVDPEEPPEIVLSFAGPVDPLKPRAVNEATDFRPEILLRQKSAAGVKSRVLIPTLNAFTHISPARLLLPFPLLVALLEGVFAAIFNGHLGSYSKLKAYLEIVKSTVEAETFNTAFFSVVHAKLVMVDENEAIIVGSPFSQIYWDTRAHNVFEPRRGAASGGHFPVHDVSLGVRGPAVKDMHDAFRLHWNIAKPAEQIAEIAPGAPVSRNYAQTCRCGLLDGSRTRRVRMRGYLLCGRRNPRQNNGKL